MSISKMVKLIRNFREKNFYGNYTKEQYHKQNKNWIDNYFDYAVHITDGGAIYLMQKDVECDVDRELRLDGANIDILIEKLKELKRIA